MKNINKSLEPKIELIYNQPTKTIYGECELGLSKYDQLELSLIDNQAAAHISGYVTKTIKSGPILELEIYPRYKKGTAPKWADLKQKVQGTTPAQEKLNRKRTCKQIERLINANFDKSGMWITVGYENHNRPSDMKEAKKDLTNYIRRVKRAFKGDIELKVIGFTESGEKSGNYHHHVLFNIQDETLLKAKWDKERYPHTDKLIPHPQTHLSGLAGYLSKQVGTRKDQAGKVVKSYTYTKNLYKPWEHVTKSETKMNRKKVEAVVKEFIHPKELFENIQPGYSFNEVSISKSDYIVGNYLHVKMIEQRKGVIKRD